MFDGLDAVAGQVPLFLDGLRVTLELLIASSAIGMVLAVPLALARVSPGQSHFRIVRGAW